MLKSGGVVILMQANFDNLGFIVGNEKTIEKMISIQPLEPFSNEVIDFLAALSKKLMNVGKEYSDVATFGFWCRKSSLFKEKEKYDDLSFRLGRGIVFHSTPSNVPVNFAFSFASGLLAGNANIVRLPAKDFDQVKIICRCINELLEKEFSNLSDYICLVKYPSNQQITDFLSSICDVRVIWGGDRTISEIRKSGLKPRATEITFADRHSIAVINSDEYLRMANKEKIANDFYNDTFYSDQNVCTSPRIIVWLGEAKKKAQEIFWGNIHKIVKEKYKLSQVQVVGKLAALFKVAAKYNINLIRQDDQYITRVQVDSLFENLMDYKYNSGFFFEYNANNLKEILPLCGVKCQTLTYIGLSFTEIKEFLFKYRPYGIDRAVPMGKSMDFTLVWDGYDLIRNLTRKFNVI